MRTTEPDPLITWEGVRATVTIMCGFIWFFAVWELGAPVLFAGWGIIIALMAALRHVTFSPAMQRWTHLLRDGYGIVFGIWWALLTHAKGAPWGVSLFSGFISLFFAWHFHQVLCDRPAPPPPKRRLKPINLRFRRRPSAHPEMRCAHCGAAVRTFQHRCPRCERRV